MPCFIPAARCATGLQKLVLRLILSGATCRSAPHPAFGHLLPAMRGEGHRQAPSGKQVDAEEATSLFPFTSARRKHHAILCASWGACIPSPRVAGRRTSTGTLGKAGRCRGSNLPVSIDIGSEEAPCNPLRIMGSMHSFPPRRGEKVAEGRMRGALGICGTRPRSKSAHGNLRKPMPHVIPGALAHPGHEKLTHCGFFASSDSRRIRSASRICSPGAPRAPGALRREMPRVIPGARCLPGLRLGVL